MRQVRGGSRRECAFLGFTDPKIGNIIGYASLVNALSVKKLIERK
jgi:hypothetical protein